MGGLKVVICEDLSRRLPTATDVFRSLIGFIGDQGNIHVTGTTLQRNTLPYGQLTVGLYCSKSCDVFGNLLSDGAKRIDCIRKSLETLGSTSFVVIMKNGDGFSAKLVNKDSLDYDDVELEVRDLNQATGVLLRTRLSLPISIEYSAAQGLFRSNITTSIQRATEWLTPSSIMYECNRQLMRADADESIRYFLRRSLERKTEPSNTTDIQEIEILRILEGDGGKLQSPVLSIHRKDGKIFQFGMNLDVASFFGYDTPANQAADFLRSALSLQASSMVDIIAESVSDDKLIPPKPKHFKVGSAFVSCCFAANQVNPFMKQFLHDDLLFDKKKPLFSSGQTVFFTKETPVYRDILQNTHSNLQPSFKSSRMALVQGNYLYFHYKQQKFDDAGWGCAYRSLQTLASWFRLQGYTDVEVPDHKKIQETLVEIGDKDSKFIGSKLWIGSQEVSFVLNQLMKIDSKTIYVSSGAEIASKASELIEHFEKQGTPIMIGGGQLAHTILGVATDDLTEETHFLILDPHYTGSEDIRTINGKGWCNWKPSSFWDKTSFYNMCLPQVPRSQI